MQPIIIDSRPAANRAAEPNTSRYPDRSGLSWAGALNQE